MGELQKRIVALGDFEFTIDEIMKYDCLDYMDGVKAKSILKIVEEMRKEVWREIDELCNIKNLHATDAINRMTDLILKWLGEPQK